MPRVSLRQHLLTARRERAALPAFNATGLDVARAAATAAADTGLPVIVQFSAGTVRSYGPRLTHAMFEAARAEADAPVYLHLDHCDDEALIFACIDAGWDMVMFDGSHRPFAENLRRTRSVVERAHAAGAAVEAELGGIGGEEDGAAAGCAVADLAEVDEFIGTGIDCLAVGFGNVHGHYKTKQALRWDVLEAVGERTTLPLVLHGGTGLVQAEIARAVAAGCAKINVSTALKDVYAALLDDPDARARIHVKPVWLHAELHRRCAELCTSLVHQFRNPHAEPE